MGVLEGLAVLDGQSVEHGEAGLDAEGILHQGVLVLWEFWGDVVGEVGHVAGVVVRVDRDHFV